MRARPGLAKLGQRGFTLGEVLGVVGVLGISLTLAIPSLTSAFQANDRARSLNELIGTLHQAHSAAVTRLRPVVVCPSTNGQACANESWDAGWIFFVDEDGDGARSAGEELLGTVGPLAGFSIHSDEFPRALMVEANGRVTGTDEDLAGGRFSFCAEVDPAQGRVLAVSGAGAPLILDPDTSAGSPRCPDDPS